VHEPAAAHEDVPDMKRLLAWAAILAIVTAAIWWTQIRPQEVRLSIYFTGPADGASTLVAVPRTVQARGAEAVLRAAFEALLAGPTAEERARGLSTEIPAGTRLRAVNVSEGVATVDLTEAIAAAGGSSSMLGRLWQIVYTGTQHAAAQQVRLIIEGQERAGLGGEGVVIDRPIGRPPAFPRF
jgi:spore germination protein GerM